MILHESHLVKTEFDPTIPCVIWTPLEFMTGEQFKVPFEQLMDLYLKKVVEYPELTWLNDTRKLQSVKLEDVKWVDQEMNPKAFKAGLKKIAFVLPEDNIFAKMSIRAYIRFTTERKDVTSEIKGFERYHQAKSWLKNDSVIEEVRI